MKHDGCGATFLSDLGGGRAFTHSAHILHHTYPRGHLLPTCNSVPRETVINISFCTHYTHRQSATLRTLQRFGIIQLSR